MRRRSAWIWCGRIAAAVVIVGLVAYLTSVGLDKASEIAGVLVLLVALVALLAPYLFPPGGNGAKQAHVSEVDPSAQRASGHVQRIENAWVGGNLTQARYTGPPRAVRPSTAERGPAGTGSAKGAAADTSPAAGPPPTGRGGQYIGGVWVSGDVSQIDGSEPPP